MAYADLSAASDFEVSQLVDKATGVHARIRRADFVSRTEPGDRFLVKAQSLGRHHWAMRVHAAVTLLGVAATLAVLGGPMAPPTAAVGHGSGVSVTPPRSFPPLPAGDPAYAGVVDHTLARGRFVVQGGSERRDIALTFDDGPSAFTPKIATILRRNHAGGTFFEIGEEFAHFPPNARRLIADDFPVGDHTLTHPLLGHLSVGRQRLEIATPAYELWRHGVPFPRLFRPPYGSFDAATFAVLAPLRMLMVLWSTDSLDYATPGVGHIVHNALAGVHAGSIILMHDGGGNRWQTVHALPVIIRRLRARGFHLVTVPQMLSEDPPRLPQRVPGGMGPAATAN